jgi:hypothetical protein
MNSGHVGTVQYSSAGCQAGAWALRSEGTRNPWVVLRAKTPKSLTPREVLV